MTKNQNVTKNLTAKAMAGTTQRAATLAAKRDSALSTFRATVQQLNALNSSLDEDIATADEMIAFYTAQKQNAEKAKSDNAAVAQHILNIIGE